MAKTLNVINNAYRANVEEQDDPIIWIAHALKNSGADVGVLLRGNAVNYAVKGHDASLTLAGKALTHPPAIDKDLGAVVAAGVEVLVVGCDAKERGIDPGQLIEGVETIERGAVAGVFDKYERVWNW